MEDLQEWTQGRGMTVKRSLVILTFDVYDFIVYSTLNTHSLFAIYLCLYSVHCEEDNTVFRSWKLGLVRWVSR